jgi:hypothetical protein
MKMRKFFHVAAVMLSSLASMICHGKGQEATGKGKDALAKHHRHHDGMDGQSDGSATDDPPRRAEIAPPLDCGDIKNSKHAATWQSYESQADEDAPPPLKLDRNLMESAEQPAMNLIVPTTEPPPPLPGDEHSRYPWKRQIVTTTFWVGESASEGNPVPNSSSCWDPHWAKNYGGDDTPDTDKRTAEYIPVAFTPEQNPFYIALPYNDMEHGTHKAEAPQVIPWFPRDYKGPTQSVCQGRWIAIRFGNKVCYAQWEDAGPFRTDHWQYVFGNERPAWNMNGGAGLDVSPAVRDFLGMNSTDVTDWKFVDFEEVPSGPWAKFGENNTFVQNGRRPGSQVVENILTGLAHELNGILPGATQSQEPR